MFWTLNVPRPRAEAGCILPILHTVICRPRIPRKLHAGGGSPFASSRGVSSALPPGGAAFARPRATFRSAADDRHTLAPRIVLNIHCLSAHVLLVFCNDVSVGSQAADEFSSVSQAERKNTFCQANQTYRRKHLCVRLPESDPDRRRER